VTQELVGAGNHHTKTLIPDDAVMTVGAHPESASDGHLTLVGEVLPTIN